MSTRLHGTSCLMDDVKSFYNLYVNNVHIIMHAHYALFSLRIFVSGVTWWKSSSLVRCLHYCGLFGLCQCLISYGTPWADCLGLLSLGIPQNGTHIPSRRHPIWWKNTPASLWTSVWSYYMPILHVAGFSRGKSSLFNCYNWQVY